MDFFPGLRNSTPLLIPRTSNLTERQVFPPRYFFTSESEMQGIILSEHPFIAMKSQNMIMRTVIAGV